MRLRAIPCLVGLVALAMGSLAEAKTYRWVNDQGIVTYSDQPPQVRPVEGEREALITEALDISGTKKALETIPAHIRAVRGASDAAQARGKGARGQDSRRRVSNRGSLRRRPRRLQDELRSVTHGIRDRAAPDAALPEGRGAGGRGQRAGRETGSRALHHRAPGGHPEAGARRPRAAARGLHAERGAADRDGRRRLPGRYALARAGAPGREAAYRARDRLRGAHAAGAAGPAGPRGPGAVALHLPITDRRGARRVCSVR